MSWLSQLSRPRLFGALFVVAAVVLGLIVATVVSTRNGSASEPLYLEQAADAGHKPFVPVAKDRARPTTGQGCDAEALITRLMHNPDLATAWLSASGRSTAPETLPGYIRTLRPKQLSEDTRVTNYQYDDGEHVAVQAVLQKGTSVLVDAAGGPKVRCASGNPLGAPSQLKSQAKPDYVGQAWPRFKPPTVVIVEKTIGPDRDRTIVERDRTTIIERDRLVPVPVPMPVCPPGQYLGNDGYCYPVPAGPVDGPCPPGQYLANDGNCYLLPPPPDANVPPPVPVPVVVCPDGTAPEQGNCPVTDPVVPDASPLLDADRQPVPVDPTFANLPLEQKLAVLREHEAAGRMTPEQVAQLREIERLAAGGSPVPPGEFGGMAPPPPGCTHHRAAHGQWMYACPGGVSPSGDPYTNSNGNTHTRPGIGAPPGGPHPVPVPVPPIQPVTPAPLIPDPPRSAVVPEAPVEEAPVEEAPVQEAPVQEAPVEQAPVQEAPVEEAPVQEAPVEEAPVQEAPVEEAPVQEAPVEQAPVQEAPVEQAPVEEYEAPVQEEPVQEYEAPAEETECQTVDDDGYCME